MDYLGQGTLTQAMTKSSFVIKVFFFSHQRQGQVEDDWSF
jgi:hypothetical protein